MRKLYFLLLLLSTTAMAQDYEKHWDKIIAFEQQGKTRSADEITGKIYRKAKRSGNEAHVIKSLFYRSKYRFTLELGAQAAILADIKAETRDASTAGKALLWIIYAQCLSDYYAKNSYIINSRQATNLPRPENPSEWTKQEFDAEFHYALAQSLVNEAGLKQTPLAPYDQIFDYLSRYDFRQQTLYEYIALENIRLLEKHAGYWPLDAENTTLPISMLNGNARNFTTADLSAVRNPDVARILELFQHLERFRPLGKTRFERLKFVYGHIRSHAATYLQALDALQKDTNDEWLTDYIRYERANAMTKLASVASEINYNSLALASIDSIIGKQKRTNADALANELKQRLTSKQLTVTLQSIVYPFEDTRALVVFRNVDSLKIRYYRIASKWQDFRSQNHLKTADTLTAQLTARTPAYTETLALPGKKDYFKHTTEFALPRIDTGTYIVVFEALGSDGRKLDATHEIVTATSLALLGDKRDDTLRYTVVDRKNGRFVTGAFIKAASFELTTDERGNADCKVPENDDRTRSLIVSTARDTLSVQNFYLYENHYYGQDKASARSDLYLDRAIYRPGQIVYFKGIVVRKDNDKNAVVPKLRLLLTASDANQKAVYETVVTTNDFGSFSGEFKLPESGLTGRYRIKLEEPDNIEDEETYDDESDTHPFWDAVDFNAAYTEFRVEEYKRPKFEVKLDPISETFTLGGKVTIKGYAKSYAGSDITGARVVCSVVEGSRFEYDPDDHDDDSVIVRDTITTDESGRFSFEFPAMPDEDEDPEDRPVYDYSVKVEVTDVNGETHDAGTLVHVGFHTLKIDATALGAQIKKDNLITLSTNNLNGQFAPAKGKLEFFRTRRFAENFKPLAFPRPEIKHFSDSEFKKRFPFESDMQELGRNLDTLALKTLPVDTAKDTQLEADLSDLPSGEYLLVFTATDDAGNLIRSESSFELTDPKLRIDPSKLLTLKQLNTNRGIL